MKRFIEIETTNLCNAACKICPHGAGTVTAPKGVMDDTTLVNIVNEINRLEITAKYIAPYMSGEPLLDKKFIQRVEYIGNSIFIDDKIDISSNGILLDKDMRMQIKLLSYKVLRPIHFVLSFHWIEKELYELNCGNHYDIALENILSFCYECTGIVPVIKCMGSEPQKAIKFFTEHLEKRNAKIPYIATGIPNNRGGNSGVRVHRLDYNNCHRIKDWLHFNWQGDLVLCCNDFNNEVVFGNINHEKLDVLMDRMYDVIESEHKKRGNDFICCRCDRCHV